MRQTLLSLLLVGCIGSVGCPWKGFNDLEDDTPVVVYTKHKHFSAPTFGQTLIVLDNIDDPLNERLPTIVVGGQYTTPLAALEIGPGGGVKNYRIAEVSSDQVRPHADREGNTVVAMTELAPVDDDARVLIGVPMHNYVRWVRIPPADADLSEPISGTMFPPEESALSGGELGGALAAGSWDAPNGPQEWAVASNDRVVIFMNESEAATTFEVCPFPGPGGNYSSVTRALAAGQFDATGLADVFVAGLPDNQAPFGAVHFIRYNGGAVDCDAAPLLPPPEAGRQEEYFGTGLAAVALDGPRVDDLIVGSPNKEDEPGTTSRVYVYLNITGGMGAQPDYILEGTTLHFGTRVAAMDLDGDGVLELVVGDPMASFNGNRGRVLIYKLPAWSPQATPEILPEERAQVVGDLSSPDKMFGADLKAKSTGFGWSVAGMKWTDDTDREELIVGAAGLVFGFYLTGVEGDDGTDMEDDPRE